MKNGSKLVVGLLLLCALALGISACGGGGDGETSGGGETSADRGEISGTIEVWDTEYESLPAYTEAIDQIDAEFEKLHPGVTVDRQTQPFEGYEALVRAAFTANEGPDLMLMQDGTAGVLNFKQGFEVLNDLISPELQEEVTQWSSGTEGFLEEGGDRYGVPIGLIGYAFYYNKELFEKAGLPRDFQPESWEELREAGEKLQAAGIQPFVGGNKEGLENAWWLSIGLETEVSAEQRTEVLNEELPYTDEVFVKGYGPAFEIAEEAGLYSRDRYTTPFLEGCGDFGDGKGAIILGFWNAACYPGEFNPKLGEENVGFFLTPGAPVTSTAAAFVMSVPKFADNKDAALALLEFEVSKKGMQTLVDVGGFMPNHVDVGLPADASEQAKGLLKASQELETEPSTSIAFPAAVQYGPMATEINQALQRRISLEDALGAMQETVEKSSP